MGATVEPSDQVLFRYRCNQCDVHGDLRESAEAANADGLAHEHEWHPRVYVVEQHGGH